MKEFGHSTDAYHGQEHLTQQPILSCLTQQM